MDEITPIVQKAISTEIGRTLLERMCQERAVFAMSLRSNDFSADFYRWLGDLALEIVTQYPLDENRVLDEVDRLAKLKES